MICIPIGTPDYIKSKTNSLNLNQRTGLSPNSRNACHPILHVKQMTTAQWYTTSVADNRHTVNAKMKHIILLGITVLN